MSEKAVYKAIAAVQADLAKAGIEKKQKNQQQGWMFRSIDDVYNALGPLLAKHGLCILPRIVDREMLDRPTKSGSVMAWCRVLVEFDIVSAEDGSMHTIKMPGEAMDSGDKSIGKAMSYAYKQACFQLFCIPTEGDNDPDNTVHEATAAANTAKAEAAGKDAILHAIAQLTEVAKKGTQHMNAAWHALPKEVREGLKPHLATLTALKQQAVAADAAIANKMQEAMHLAKKAEEAKKAAYIPEFSNMTQEEMAALPPFPTEMPG